VTDVAADAVAFLGITSTVTFEPFDGAFVTAPARPDPPAPKTLPRDHVFCSNVLSQDQRRQRGSRFGPVCRTLVWLDDTSPKCPFCGSIP
jgi:hypothetical protein